MPGFAETHIWGGVVPTFYLGPDKAPELSHLEEFLMCAWKCSAAGCQAVFLQSSLNKLCLLGWFGH